MKLSTPSNWTDTGQDDPFFSALAEAEHAILMLDYDGTLAPFREDRLKTSFYPGVKKRINKLMEVDAAELVFISGRNAAELRSLLALEKPVDIWGSHGREHLAANGHYFVTPLTLGEESILHHVRSVLEREYDPANLEVKPNSVAIHWRNGSIKKAEVEKRVREVYQEATSDKLKDGNTNLLQFDGGLEVRAGEGGKGFAVQSILETLPRSTMAAFLGDDTTDEDAFKVLRSEPFASQSLPVLVRNEARPTYARCWIRPPEQLLQFLDTWLHTRESRSR